MPSITAAEITIVVAAVLLLYVAPFLLTTIEAARRRQAQQAGSSPFEQAEVPLDERAVSASTRLESGPTAAAAALSSCPQEHVLAAMDENQPPDALAPERASPTGAEEAPPCDAVRYAGYEPPAVSPFHGGNGYRFRLEDLHRARLADWPPEHVHRDPTQHQVWVEAERLAAAHDAAISVADLVAPCPVRSVCLGGCERGPSRTRLHFLLFPDLWPVSPEQAVARAVFAIDAATGTIAHSVDALQRSA